MDGGDLSAALELAVMSDQTVTILIISAIMFLLGVVIGRAT